MRALLIILDGAGCGDAADAAAFGDEGANTLGRIFQAHPGLRLPTLYSLGLWKLATGDVFDARSQGTAARWGRMRARSPGKDSMSGHWEIAGVILDKSFRIFVQFPEELVAAIERDAGVAFLGNRAQSGALMLEEFGAEHLRTGKPILYTSADSVMQIAAHESVMTRMRLQAICRAARRRANAYGIGRVIARPFTGAPGAFQRAAGRYDYSMVPPRTVLNALADAGLEVHGVGKIREIFAGSGVTRSTPANSNAEGFLAIERAWESAQDGLIFANLAEFDRPHGHRRDITGCARAWEEFDGWLESFLSRVEPEDLVILTGDHGNDPGFRGTEHTREETPLIALHRQQTGPLGTRRTFADIAATLAEYFRLRQKWAAGESFLSERGRGWGG